MIWKGEFLFILLLRELFFWLELKFWLQPASPQQTSTWTKSSVKYRYTDFSFNKILLSSNECQAPLCIRFDFNLIKCTVFRMLSMQNWIGVDEYIQCSKRLCCKYRALVNNPKKLLRDTTICNCISLLSLHLSPFSIAGANMRLSFVCFSACVSCK